MRLLSGHEIAFTRAEHLEFNRRETLSYHPNGMRFTARDDEGAIICERAYYSIGGGFVADETGTGSSQDKSDGQAVPYPFTTAAELLTSRFGYKEFRPGVRTYPAPFSYEATPHPALIPQEGVGTSRTAPRIPASSIVLSST